MSDIDVVLSMSKPGTDAPSVIDSKVARMPVKVTILTLSFWNQLRATLLGVFRTNMFPIAARHDPIRQK